MQRRQHRHSREKKGQSKEKEGKDKNRRKEENVKIIGCLKKRARNKRNKAYGNLARIKATILKTVDQNAFETLQLVLILRQKTEEASEAMDRFEILLLIKVVKTMIKMV